MRDTRIEAPTEIPRLPEDGRLTIGSSDEYLLRLPTAFGVTRGAQHTLVFANAAFHRLTAASGGPTLGLPLAQSLIGRKASRLAEVLDKVRTTGVVERERHIEFNDDKVSDWVCTVWPSVDADGEPDHLMFELHVATNAELTRTVQREVAERMLISALREHEVAESAEALSRRTMFLATESRHLAESLDERATLTAVSRLSLPSVAAWCIVDLVDDDGTMRRLAIVHPDERKQALFNRLEGHWQPVAGDSFGVPAMLTHMRPTIVANQIDAVVAAGAHDLETLVVLQRIGIGPLLTVPILVRGRLAGAITFVAERESRGFTFEDVALAEDLGARSAMALENARMHGEVVVLKAKAEAASEAKSTFLGTVSHELRTPLQAMGAYLDLLDMGAHGPVTEMQRADLARIRKNQQHLVVLISDLLNFVRVGSGRATYEARDIVMLDVLAEAVALVEPLIVKKQFAFDGVVCETSIMARADLEKTKQIVVNLLANALKFTPPSGRVGVDCSQVDDKVLVRVSDSGIGIPSDQHESVFQPFVQVAGGVTGHDAGIGLGLSISRNLARAMGGDLTVESELGRGSTFTLSLPRAVVMTNGQN